MSVLDKLNEILSEGIVQKEYNDFDSFIEHRFNGLTDTALDDLVSKLEKKYPKILKDWYAEKL
jgi:hypothetical protein